MLPGIFSCFDYFMHFVREIETQLEFAKHNSEWRRDFMMMSIHDQDKLIEGMDRGIAEGIAIGKAEAHQSMAIQMSREGLSVDMIARIVKESVSVIQGWIDEAKA